jgi:hypothetical protein
MGVRDRGVCIRPEPAVGNLEMTSDSTPCDVVRRLEIERDSAGRL